MWPFSCKECIKKDSDIEEKDSLIKEGIVIINSLRTLSKLAWVPFESYTFEPPTNTNLLVANHDFTFFGFLYYEDGWYNGRKINMQCKDKVWPTYTNPDSISWWLNLDLIKRDNER